ncbi:MAG: hypothetical protein BroJett011_07970 [Chloroflexota bacterium]|nr:MAG: hypothetical protein BroJett011_07970 [Chloroflexota bacterium]
MEPHSVEQKATIAGLYNRVAATYGRVGPAVFDQFGRWLVEWTGLSTGSRVLDVGMGRGANLFPASDIVGTHGQVVGIDLAGAMVQETAAEVRRSGRRKITMLQMDAECLAFPDATFDGLLCGFTLFFMLHPQQALAEWYRVVRPGGRVGVSVAGTGDERWQWYEALLQSFHQIYHFSLNPGGGGLRRPSEIEAALTAAGFVNIQVMTTTHEFVYANEAEWWRAKWTHGARYPLERMSPEVLDQFKAEVLARLEPLKEADGFHEQWQLVCLLGRKPEQTAE